MIRELRLYLKGQQTFFSSEGPESKCLRVQGRHVVSVTHTFLFSYDPLKMQEPFFPANSGISQTLICISVSGFQWQT